MNRADVHRIRTAAMLAGELPTTESCPKCGGAIYFDRDVEVVQTGRIIPVQAVCDRCFYTVEVK